MGFNSPEWAFSYTGATVYNCVVTGIYITNTAEACLYQLEHSEAEVVVCETNEMLKRITVNLAKTPRIKAIVVWGETQLPTDVQDSRLYLWKDFMKLGAEVKDQVIMDKINRQKPGECNTLIYTSGTTGNPKGCMLSHDNLIAVPSSMLNEWAKVDPSANTSDNRVVSYLPLSHIAGLCVDLIGHIYNGHELYFARADALQGTIV